MGTVWIAAAYKNEIVAMKQEGDEGRKGNVEKGNSKCPFVAFVEEAEMRKKCYSINQLEINF